VSQRPTANPETILIRTRFSYPRARFSWLLVRIGLRGAILIAVLLALFALWTVLHLWPYYYGSGRFFYNGGQFLLRLEV
jgi:hypothetical protein